MVEKSPQNLLKINMLSELLRGARNVRFLIIIKVRQVQPCTLTSLEK